MHSPRPMRPVRKGSFHRSDMTPAYTWNTITKTSSSPDDGDTLKRQIQIDMRGLVGDSVGSMSISPTSRDVVLAARKGLFIIDLNIHSKVPRFLPQGGTWDVADVQWNPHPSHVEYIVSTSSEKLLIWNLRKTGNAIEHVLHQHYRAITDINWHTTEPETVISTGIDSWLWAWDLREPRKPMFGLSAFNAGGTQVKWNRQDGNIIASSHANSVLIWDRRKGSLPIAQIEAHGAKIYGIDWSHDRRTEIITCSLDKTIKVWDINALCSSDSGASSCTKTIRTSYPVWRARDLPFGRGVLSLPQRGETILEMFAYSDSEQPIELFEGHEEAVKEFVWRRAGDEFQLVTWSKDRTLRTWPIDPETMTRAGHAPPGRGRTMSSHSSTNSAATFTTVPHPSQHSSAISAPIGKRSILGEVRATSNSRLQSSQPPIASSALKASLRPGVSASTVSINVPTTRSARHGSTISRGNFTGKSLRSATVDPFAWLSCVKVGVKRGRDGSGGVESSTERSLERASSRQRVSEIGNGVGDEPDETLKPLKDEGGAALQDELRVYAKVKSGLIKNYRITSVLTKLTSSKIKLEKHDLAKKRTCTLGFQGPWGENNVSVFIRISFTFPREYPHGIHPSGTPTIDLERNPLIHIRTRAQIIRKLRTSLVMLRPCLEACLRFLLFRNENVQDTVVAIPSESSDEDDIDGERREKDGTVVLLRNIKNLAEPRTSQGVFGPNGQLVCFFRAPHRVIRELSDDSHTRHSSLMSNHERRLKPASLLSEAVQRLSHISAETAIESLKMESSSKKREESDKLTRTMNNLLTFSSDRHSPATQNDSAAPGGATPSYSPFLNVWSTVYISNLGGPAEVDEAAAASYTFDSKDLSSMCHTNAQTAADIQRYDHERTFLSLAALLPPPQKEGLCSVVLSPARLGLLHKLLNKLHAIYLDNKDIQMLAFVSLILINWLQLGNDFLDHDSPQITVSKSRGDYFSHKPKMSHSTTPSSPGWRPQTSTSFTMSSSTSSRGSWSSIFNRPFTAMAAAKDNSPSSIYHPPTPSANPERSTPMPVRHRRFSRNSPLESYPATSKSWSDARLSLSIPPNELSFASKPLGSKETIHEKKRLVFRPTQQDGKQHRSQSGNNDKFIAHVLAYAEVLFGLQLHDQRAELLKAIKYSPFDPELAKQHTIGLTRSCKYCHSAVMDSNSVCEHCGQSTTTVVLRCTICRLAVTGLSYNCPKCLHVSHVSCRRLIPTLACPTGCGCECIL